MSFRILGDMIEYEYRPFARIVAPPGVLLDCACEDLESCDRKAREREEAKRCEEVEADHAEQIETLQGLLDEALKGRAALEYELQQIEDAGGLPYKVAELRVEIKRWREAAEAARKTARALQAQIEESRKRGPKGSKTVRLTPQEVWALRAHLTADTFVGDIARRVCQAEDAT